VSEKNWQDEAKRVAEGIRRRVTEFTLKNGGGYLSQACSSAEILATLYTRVMKLGPSVAPPVPSPFGGVPGKNPDYTTGAGYNGPRKPELDRFFISPVHYALVLYATLVETGRMAEEGLAMFNQDGSTVEMIGAEHSPGHELMAGSLGQALSQVIGIALGRRRKGETGRNFVFMSDGEFMIGQTWEAMETLSFYRLDSVIAYVDANGQSADGKIDEVMGIEPLKERLEAWRSGRPSSTTSASRGPRKRRRSSASTCASGEVGSDARNPGPPEEPGQVGGGQARGGRLLRRPDQLHRGPPLRRDLPRPLLQLRNDRAEHDVGRRRHGPRGVHPLGPHLRRLPLPPRPRPGADVGRLPQPAGAHRRLPARHHHPRRGHPPGHRGRGHHARRSQHDRARDRRRRRRGERARRGPGR